jgi:hypothetical protein
MVLRALSTPTGAPRDWQQAVAVLVPFSVDAMVMPKPAKYDDAVGKRRG